MKSFNLIITVVIVISFLGIGLLGCSEPPAKAPAIKDVEGTWVAIKKEAYKLGGGQQVGFVIEFFSDKTVMLPSGKGSWDILQDGRLKIDIPNMTMHGALQGNILTITMPDQQGTVVFKRQ